MVEKAIGITAPKSRLDEWYPQAIVKAEIADYSPVKGCMVIRPHGYGMWEHIQQYFDGRIKKLGVKNAYFPLFIPESFFKKEAQHAEGFAPEGAWIANSEEGERLAIRPTSETIMYDMYSRWIRSYRDLPLRINQWANVVRWETKATKLFLRTREFLWQEGHCVYETDEECAKETRLYLDEYQKLCEEVLGVAVIAGRKTEHEKFAGAKYTLSVEAFMPDGKGLQMATSHHLGQNFAKAFGISYLGKDEEAHLPYQNSWGISTRTIGAVIMEHGDDKGVVIPPAIAPIHCVVIPILFGKHDEAILQKAKDIQKKLKWLQVELDDRKGYTPGWKYNEWEMKGVPLRIEIGPKDIEKNCVVVIRRDTGEKQDVACKDIVSYVKACLEDIQKSMLRKSKERMAKSIVHPQNWEEVVKALDERKLVLGLFCGKIECEAGIKEKTGATSRNIPFDQKGQAGKCLHCGKETSTEIYFSKGY